MKALLFRLSTVYLPLTQKELDMERKAPVKERPLGWGLWESGPVPNQKEKARVRRRPRGDEAAVWSSPRCCTNRKVGHVGNELLHVRYRHLHLQKGLALPRLLDMPTFLAHGGTGMWNKPLCTSYPSLIA